MSSITDMAARAAKKTRKQLDEQAAEWFVILRSSSLSGKDKQAFKAWCGQSTDHQKAYDEYEQFWQSTQALEDDNDMLGAYEEILARRRAAYGGWRRGALWAVPIAALVLFVVVSGLLTSLWPGGEVYDTGVGEQRTVMLADGTTVKLNTNTHLSVSYSSASRHIELVRGQAFFNVARDEGRPFSVHYGDTSVLALGTQFDVYQKPGALQVTIVEGKISVSKSPEGLGSKKEEKLLAAASGDRVVQQIVSAQGGLSDVSKTKVNAVMAWQDQKLIFDDKPLPEALAEVNRYSRRKIRLGDDKLTSLRLSGVFQVSQQDLVVDMIRDYFSIRVETDEKGDLILRSQTNG